MIHPLVVHNSEFILTFDKCILFDNNLFFHSVITNDFYSFTFQVGEIYWDFYLNELHTRVV